MTTIGTRPPRAGRQPYGRLGLWRAVSAAPPVLGSAGLVMLAAGALGREAGLLPLAWAACAALMRTRVGERVTVAAVYRFCPPGPGQTASLLPAWAAALRVTGTDPGEVDLYVATARTPNAYAVGRRSVAVTRRVVEDYESGRLPEAQLVAVLVHELGHHVTGATRPTLLLWWLTAPWRVTSGLLSALARSLVGHPRGRGPVLAVAGGWAVALTQALQQGHWMVGGMLLFVGLSAAACPLAAAAVSRQAEFAADRFAADHGLALELAAALHTTDDGRSAAAGWPRRLLASHPTSGQRIRALLTTRADSRS
jgi:STE24 endopeptidase